MKKRADTMTPQRQLGKLRRYCHFVRSRCQRQSRAQGSGQVHKARIIRAVHIAAQPIAPSARAASASLCLRRETSNSIGSATLPFKSREFSEASAPKHAVIAAHKPCMKFPMVLLGLAVQAQNYMAGDSAAGYHPARSHGLRQARRSEGKQTRRSADAVRQTPRLAKLFGARPVVLLVQGTKTSQRPDPDAQRDQRNKEHSHTQRSPGLDAPR